MKSIIENENVYTFMIGIHEYMNELRGIQVDKNLIMRLDEDSKEVRTLSFIPDVPKGIKAFHRVKVVGEKAYFVPFEYDQLYIFDYVTEKYSKISLNLKAEKKVAGKGYFYEIIIIENQAILLPFAYRGIIVIDLISRTIKDIDIEYDYPVDKELFLFRTYLHIKNNKIAIPSLSSNKIMLFDYKKHKYEIIKLEENIKIGGIYQFDKKIYITCKNRLRIWQVDESFKHFSALNCFDEAIYDDRERLTYFDPETVAYYNGKMYLFPAKWNHSLEIDLATMSARIIEELEKYCTDSNILEHISVVDGGIQIGNSVYLHYQLGKIIKYNLENHEVVTFSTKLHDKGNLILKDFINRVI